MSQDTDPRTKVHDILKGFSTAMFVTVGANGELQSRPMHVARAEEHAVWFLTGNRGTLVDQVQEGARILLVFQSDSAFLSLRGDARIVEDKAQIKALWKEPYKVWFPGGVDDPEIALVAVDPTAAEYWDNRGANKLEYLFEAARAYFKGEKPQVGDVDQHGKTSL